jgi:outer membrane protein TolC
MILLFLLLIGVSYGIELSEAVNKALSYYPSLKALEEERRGIEGKALFYRSYLNPTVGLELGNFGTSKDGVRSSPIYKFSYSQPVLIYPLSSFLKEAVKQELSAFDEGIAQERNAIVGDVYLAFYTTLYKRELLRIAEEDYQTSQDIYSFVKKLFDLGEITKLDLFRAERELDIAKTELELAKSDYQSAIRRLSLFLNEDVKDLDGSIEDLRDMKALQFENLPQVKRYEYLVKSTKANIQVERTLAKPQLSVDILAEKVSQSEYGFRAGFSVSLPIFYKRQAEIIQLSSQARSLERLKELEKIKTQIEYERLVKRYETIKSEVKRIDDTLLVKAREELSLAMKSYRLRTITSLELSETKRRYIQLLRYRLDLLMQAHEAYSRYLSLGGQL